MGIGRLNDDPQTVFWHDPDLLLAGILFARGPFDVLDDLLARAVRCLSHRPLLRGYDEPKTLSDQFTLIGPIGADVRHAAQ